MIRLAALAPLLLCLVIPSTAMSGPSAKEVEVNGVVLPYLEQGAGEPVVLVHGSLSDLRVWEPVREEIAKSYRYIAYTRRYHGLGAWKDDGKDYNAETHVDDLAKFIQSLNAGPVHLVGRSGGAAVATIAALRHPSLVRSLTVYEPPLISVLPAASAEGKAAREDQAQMLGPAAAANKAGDSVQAARLFIEGVYGLPPGGFESLPPATQTMMLENARTLPPSFAALPPAITCDMLKTITQPTLVMRGEKTRTFFRLISEAVGNCVPGARQVVIPNVNHGGPSRDPAAFTAAVLAFISKS